jgi:protein TonB
MSIRAAAWGGAVLAAALLVNLGLFALAGLLVSERDAPEEFEEPVGVSLVSLTPPEPPKQEDVKEPEPPQEQPKPDFMPDLVQPSIGDLGGADIGVAIDIGDVGGQAGKQEFIFDSVDLDQAPQAKVQIPPAYPYRAREQGIEGYVAVKILVRSDGSVGQVNVLKAKPKGLFEDAVRETVPKWRFEPGKIGGDPVTAWVVTTIRFDLN